MSETSETMNPGLSTKYSLLTRLADFLEELDDGKFDYSSYVSCCRFSEGGARCGTVCCAFGWLPRACPETFSWVRADAWLDSDQAPYGVVTRVDRKPPQADHHVDLLMPGINASVSFALAEFMFFGKPSETVSQYIAETDDDTSDYLGLAQRFDALTNMHPSYGDLDEYSREEVVERIRSVVQFLTEEFPDTNIEAPII